MRRVLSGLRARGVVRQQRRLHRLGGVAGRRVLAEAVAGDVGVLTYGHLDCGGGAAALCRGR